MFVNVNNILEVEDYFVKVQANRRENNKIHSGSKPVKDNVDRGAVGVNDELEVRKD